jgi:hypothetical protein
MKPIEEAVTEDVKNTFAEKLSSVENNYQKEIELMKKKFDSETQALLDGFDYLMRKYAHRRTGMHIG